MHHPLHKASPCPANETLHSNSQGALLMHLLIAVLLSLKGLLPRPTHAVSLDHPFLFLVKKQTYILLKWSQWYMLLF